MTTAIDDLEETKKRDLDEEETPSLVVQLLRFQDDLNIMLGEQDFYLESVKSLFEQDDGDVLRTKRQQSGLANIGCHISEKGSALSDRLEVIRKKLGDIGKQLR